MESQWHRIIILAPCSVKRNGLCRLPEAPGAAGFRKVERSSSAPARPPRRPEGESAQPPSARGPTAGKPACGEWETRELVPSSARSDVGKLTLRNYEGTLRWIAS